MMDLFLKLWIRIRRMWLYVVSLIFPRRCAGCDLTETALCVMCCTKLKGVFVKGEIDVDGFRVFFAAEHSELLKKVLHRFKYVSDEALGEALGGLLVRRMKGMMEEISGRCVIVPVPLYHRRERERGFNQSELLARVVTRDAGGEVAGLLERCRETEVQARLKRVERIKNVKGAFWMRNNVGVPDTVFVLDDVITTGSTFVACARVLRQAGVRRVYGIMLAHGL